MMTHHSPSTMCPKAQEDDGYEIGRRHPHGTKTKHCTKTTPEYNFVQMLHIFPGDISSIPPQGKECLKFTNWELVSFQNLSATITTWKQKLLKVKFGPPKKNALQKKWSRWRLVCLRLSPSATATWNLATLGCHAFNRCLFFGVGEKKTTSGGRLRFPVSKRTSSKVYTPVFCFMLCLFNVFFPKKNRVVHQQFHKKAGQIDVCWWSFIRGDVCWCVFSTHLLMILGGFSDPAV